MEEILLHTHDGVEQTAQSAAWYHALTLAERSPLLRSSDRVSVMVADNDLAMQTFQRWKKQPPFQEGTYFEQRLAMDALSESDLLTLLAQPMDVLQSYFASPPAWMQKLISICAGKDVEGASLPLQQIKDSNTLAFLAILTPFLQHSMAHLQAGIRDLVQSYEQLPFDPHTISSLLFARVPKLVLPMLTRTIVLELNVARVQGLLQGETPEQRFQHFLAQLAQPGGMNPIWEEYPVLARQIMETLEQWAVCELEFLERLCRDWQEIRAIFGSGSGSDVLIEVQEGAGDMHRGGRSTTLLAWSSGLRLAYKPRSLAIDVHFQELLNWLNERGFQPAFRTLTLINKETYGWCEFVEAAGCTSTEEISRFYRRQGGYLALLYALAAADVHAENVIAAGEYPMLIDLEALFQPRIRVQSTTGLEYAAMCIGQSVLQVGLLPLRLWSNENGTGIDVSGLGGQTGQLTPMPVPLWKEKGTDRMRLTRECIEFALGKHRPTLHGQDVNTLAYSDEIINGFTSLYCLLIQHRAELLTSILPRFARDEIRSLLRPSNNYATLLLESFHPNVLRDALDRDRILDRLWIGVESSPYLTSVIAAERADLLRGDIPLFRTSVSSCDLYTSDDEIIAEFFCEPGLVLVQKRIKLLDMQDMERQAWVIQAALSSLTLGRKGTARRTLSLQPSESSVTYERLITMARSIGDRLDQLALRSEDSVGWLGLSPVNEQEWNLLPVGIDLYGGLPGIAFFLGYLGALTGVERYSILARQAVKTAGKQVAWYKEYSCIGAFEGLGGWIYFLAHMGRMWSEPELYREAQAVVRRLPDLIEMDDCFDLSSGAAGCILSLLSLYEVAPSDETLAVALQCGKHLIAHAVAQEVGIGWHCKQQTNALTGLSHGNAGIALALLRLWEVSSEDSLREAALSALAYERSVFSPAQGNWPDLRDKSDGRQTYMVTWCHGAPGIGLARLGLLRYNDDAVTRREIDTAVRTTVTNGFGRNHALCHGDMGNIELLLLASRQLAKPFYIEQLRRLVPMLLDSIDIQGWCSAISSGVETPGLMIGLAGTGYALLRLAAPERVPSLLLLEMPRIY